VLLFYWLLRREKSGEATSFLYLVPAVTAIAAVPILGQPLHPLVIAGLVLALAGTTMVAGGVDGSMAMRRARARRALR
jgi:drug/metabolite transporter (DMT)-like permease